MSDQITITGNIATEPERRSTPSGVAVTSFRLASSQRHFDRTKNEWVETSTNWYTVSAFRSLGENALESLHKGERVVITGRLRLREWESGAKKGLSVEIDADSIGHDLRWGTSRYRRTPRPGTAPESTVLDETSSSEGHDVGEAWATSGDWGAPVDDAPEDAGTGPSLLDVRSA